MLSVSISNQDRAGKYRYFITTHIINLSHCHSQLTNDSQVGVNSSRWIKRVNRRTHARMAKRTTNKKQIKDSLWRFHSKVLTHFGFYEAVDKDTPDTGWTCNLQELFCELLSSDKKRQTKMATVVKENLQCGGKRWFWPNCSYTWTKIRDAFSCVV